MFVRGGGVNPGDYLDVAGNYGNYWSSVGVDDSTAYLLFFYSLGVRPSGFVYRYPGYSVRCVALGG